MIGNLVHYNCAGSKALGIVTDCFRYEGPGNRSFIKGDLIVSVEWVTHGEKIPSQLYPHQPWQPDAFEQALPDDAYWPVYWSNKKWYNMKFIKIISTARPD